MQAKKAFLNLDFLVMSHFAVWVSIFAQDTQMETKEKPSFNIEEEYIGDMGAEEQPTPKKRALEAEEEESIIIRGEDELLVKSRKKTSGLIEPTSEKNIQWNFYEPPDLKLHKTEEEKKPERTAMIHTGYGLYDHLNADLSLHTGSKKSAHSIVYQRTHKDGEGRGAKIIENSSFSFDQIISTNIFKVSDAYRLFLRGYFLLSAQELQENSVFDHQAQNSFFAEFANLLTFSEQKIRVSVKAQDINSQAHKTSEAKGGSEKGRFTSLEFKGLWDYFFGERNSLGAKAHFFYAGNKRYENQNDRYLQGTLGAWLLIPVYSALRGEKSIPWDIHLKLGFDIFFSEQTSPIPVPELRLESQYDFWRLHFSIRRKTRTPGITTSYLEKSFFKPIHFPKPEDKWEINLDNQFDLKKTMSLLFDAGFFYYNVYYYPTLANDGLYDYAPQSLRLVYGEINWKHNAFKFLEYSLGLRGEYFVDRVRFRPPVYFIFDANMNWKKFDFSVQFKLTDQRDTSDEILPLYVLLDIRLYMTVTRLMKFYIALDNVLNQEYIFLPPYKTSGITFVAGLRVKI